MPAPARRPRYARFIGSGIALGIVVATVLAGMGHRDAPYTHTSVVLYLLVISTTVGGILGGGFALLLERPDRSGADTAGHPDP